MSGITKITIGAENGSSGSKASVAPVIAAVSAAATSVPQSVTLESILQKPIYKAKKQVAISVAGNVQSVSGPKIVKSKQQGVVYEFIVNYENSTVKLAYFENTDNILIIKDRNTADEKSSRAITQSIQNKLNPLKQADLAPSVVAASSEALTPPPLTEVQSQPRRKVGQDSDDFGDLTGGGASSKQMHQGPSEDSESFTIRDVSPSLTSTPAPKPRTLTSTASAIKAGKFNEYVQIEFPDVQIFDVVDTRVVIPTVGNVQNLPESSASSKVEDEGVKTFKLARQTFYLTFEDGKFQFYENEPAGRNSGKSILDFNAFQTEVLEYVRSIDTEINRLAASLRVLETVDSTKYLVLGEITNEFSEAVDQEDAQLTKALSIVDQQEYLLGVRNDVLNVYKQVLEEVHKEGGLNSKLLNRLERKFTSDIYTSFTQKYFTCPGVDSVAALKESAPKPIYTKSNIKTILNGAVKQSQKLEVTNRVDNTVESLSSHDFDIELDIPVFQKALLDSDLSSEDVAKLNESLKTLLEDLDRLVKSSYRKYRAAQEDVFVDLPEEEIVRIDDLVVKSLDPYIQLKKDLAALKFLEFESTQNKSIGKLHAIDVQIESLNSLKLNLQTKAKEFNELYADFSLQSLDYDSDDAQASEDFVVDFGESVTSKLNAFFDDWNTEIESASDYKSAQGACDSLIAKVIAKIDELNQTKESVQKENSENGKQSFKRIQNKRLAEVVLKARQDFLDYGEDSAVIAISPTNVTVSSLIHGSTGNDTSKRAGSDISDDSLDGLRNIIQPENSALSRPDTLEITLNRTNAGVESQDDAHQLSAAAVTSETSAATSTATAVPNFESLKPKSLQDLYKTLKTLSKKGGPDLKDGLFGIFNKKAEEVVPADSILILHKHRAQSATVSLNESQKHRLVDQLNVIKETLVPEQENTNPKIGTAAINAIAAIDVIFEQL